ncbi:MAG TPA: hypothetical protein VEU96_28875 [Bryobacteraceae bacterium]|nr:hypothetical protein [Bryobacteraceae bacterium]
MLDKTAVVILTILMTADLSAADAVSFHDTRIVDKKQRQVHADLIFSSDSKSMTVRVADNNYAQVPYDAIDHFSYEFSKKHRFMEGALVMVAWIPAGLIVMTTKSKSHWLYIDYKQDGIPRELVVLLHKREYKKILDTAQRETGKNVENIQEAR